jgi:hypothetical protein
VPAGIAVGAAGPGIVVAVHVHASCHYATIPLLLYLVLLLQLRLCVFLLLLLLLPLLLLVLLVLQPLSRVLLLFAVLQLIQCCVKPRCGQSHQLAALAQACMDAANMCTCRQGHKGLGISAVGSCRCHSVQRPPHGCQYVCTHVACRMLLLLVLLLLLPLLLCQLSS